MQKIIDEIKGCVEQGYYFAALSLSLTIPNVCASYENKRRASSHDYEKWCTQWLIPELPYDITGEIVYSLRCSFFHAMDAKMNKRTLREYNEKLDRNATFTFFIPHEGTKESFVYIKEDGKTIRWTICVSAFVFSMITALEKFETENPDFTHDYYHIWFEG